MMTRIVVQGLSVELASEDGSLRLGKEEVQAYYQTTNGNAAARRQKTIDWVIASFQAALGSSVDVAAEVMVEFGEQFEILSVTWRKVGATEDESYGVFCQP